MMKPALVALALALVPATAHADEAPDPPKKEDGCVAGDGLGAVALVGAVGIVARAARRRSRA